MAASVITADLFPDVRKGEYRETLRKGKNLALLFFAQYLFKKMISGISISNQFMIGIQCYSRVNDRDKNFYISSIVAIATVILGFRSLLSGDHGFLDLAAAGLSGIVFGTLWNYSLA